MRFWIGLLVGAALGATGTYLAIETPWRSGERAAVAPDAGVAVAATDPKAAKKARKGAKRRGGAAREPAGDGESAPVLSAADKTLVWKGQAVKLPDKTMDFEGGGEARSLTTGEINGVIQGSSAAVVSCINEARGNAALEATVVLKMLVDGDGVVTKVGVKAPAYLFAHGFLPCATAAARDMRFPAVGGHTVVSAPYDLY